MTTPAPSSPAEERPANQHFHHAPDQTELARFLNRTLEKIEPYTSQILIGIIAVTVVGVGLIWWLRSEGAGRTAGWQQFAAARVPDDFETVANAHAGSSVGHWARLEAGRGFLDEGLKQALTNREASDERLNRAKESFESLLKSTQRIDPVVREEALLGMATVLEALSDGKTEPAVQAYQQLVQEFPESRHAPWARNRVEVLQTQTAEDFYAWFRKQNPRPSDRPAPRDFHSMFDPDQLRLDMPADSPGTTDPLPLGAPPISSAADAEADSDVPPSPALPRKLEAEGAPAPETSPRAFPPESNE